MSRESRGARVGRLILAGWDLIRLEVLVVTGGRGLVMALLLLAYFAAVALWTHFRDEPVDAAWFYNGLLVLPASVQAVALGMVAIAGERDTRQLEVTFVTPAGRHLVWAFRMIAVEAACVAAAAVLSVLAWVLDRDHAIVLAVVHAAAPLALATTLTMFGSVAFRSGAAAGLATSVVAFLSLFVHGSQWDVFWFNPFDPPETLLDADAWVRAVLANRSITWTFAGLAGAGTLWLLQKRERLV